MLKILTIAPPPRNETYNNSSSSSLCRHCCLLNWVFCTDLNAYACFFLHRLFQADDIDDYEDLHAFPVRNPDTQYDWEDDDTFARLRLQGENDLYTCILL